MSRDAGLVSGGFQLLKTPDAPTGLVVSPGIGSLTVNFTAPSNTGDGAITSYVASAVNESTGASVGVSGSAAPLTITDSAATYKVRVQAYNVYGPGRLTEYATGANIYSGASLWSWGANGIGELAQNDLLYRSSPVQVGALTTWSLVKGYGNTMSAIKTDGTLWMWGNNNRGQLATNDVNLRSSPVQVGALTTWARSDTSQHTLAVKTDGTLWAWGTNAYGQLGANINYLTYRSSPVQVGALTNWYDVSCGAQHSLATKTDGTLWAWGRNNQGQLGLDLATTVFRSSPVQVGALTNWRYVSAGGENSAAIKTDGTLWAWGYYTGVPTNSATSTSSPVQIGVLTGWSIVSQGQNSSHGINAGRLFGWGNNSFGSIGNNSSAPVSSPIQIGTGTNWFTVGIRAGVVGSAIKADGTLWTWGDGLRGATGQNNRAYRSSPVQVGALTSWYQVQSSTFTTALYGTT